MLWTSKMRADDLFTTVVGLTNVRQHMHRRTHIPPQPRALTYLARVMSC